MMCDVDGWCWWMRKILKSTGTAIILKKICIGGVEDNNFKRGIRIGCRCNGSCMEAVIQVRCEALEARTRSVGNKVLNGGWEI